MLFAATANDQEWRAIGAIGFELGFAVRLDAHVAFGVGEAVLREPAFGLGAV